MKREHSTKTAFGDFQTPPGLARDVCALIKRAGFAPASVIEPTCGRGAFLLAALEAFPAAGHFFGADINGDYVEEAIAAADSLSGAVPDRNIQISQGDFFEIDWPSIVADLPKPLLVLGNPPWVTNAALGALGSANLPQKANHDNLRGIEALTGKSNFDISEAMLRRSLAWFAEALGMLAVLCKTAVARKVLAHAWSHNSAIESAKLYRIDAKLHFDAAVDACLLLIRFAPGARTQECDDYASLEATEPQATFGLRHGVLVADTRLYDQWHMLAGRGLSGWRSGIKHDCSKVFELTPRRGAYVNGLGAPVDIEPDVLFPLLKSSDLARNRPPRKWLLVPQPSMAASPDDLRSSAPRAWRYLLAHSALLAKRGSSIYRKRHRFSIFGVGPYSFSPWKVAIAGLYKQLEFVQVAPFQGRSVVFDDTCYFFACRSEEECQTLYTLVQSEPAQAFWSSLIFWDAKRPVTAQILNSLDLEALARVAGMESRVTRVLAERQLAPYTDGAYQPLLLREATSPYALNERPDDPLP